MRKADRLFQLVNLIRVRQPVTAAALSTGRPESGTPMSRCSED